MKGWDASIERRGGGLDASMAMDSQEISMTNLSSLYALIATVVQRFYQGTLVKKLVTVTPETMGTMETMETGASDIIEKAAKSVRVLIFFGAGAADIDLLNGLENIEQQERKRHGELDNIAAVRD